MSLIVGTFHVADVVAVLVFVVVIFVAVVVVISLVVVVDYSKAAM